ncbi:hypothetical protein ACROYT_G008005 [Oculina patagonica]
MELVENAYPEAAYSFKVELARDQLIQGVAISDDFMSQPASLVTAVRVVRRLESARKVFQAVPSVEKKKSVNVVSASADGDKISTEIRELKEIVLGMNVKIKELESKAKKKSTTPSRRQDEVVYSGIYVSGLVNHRLMCVLVDTGATVSVLSEGAWEKSGNVSGLKPVTGRLTTANGNKLTVLGEAEANTSEATSTSCTTPSERDNRQTAGRALSEWTDDVLEAVGGAQWFTCLDLASGYCQLQVKEEDRPRTAFSTHREPQGQGARWLERLQEYDYEVTHRPGKQHCNADALSRRPRRNHEECLSCVPSVNSQVAAVTGMPQTGQGGVGKGPWSQEGIAQAQREDPDIGPVVEQLSRDWKKPTFEDLQSMSRATRAVFGNLPSCS